MKLVKQSVVASIASSVMLLLWLAIVAVGPASGQRPLTNSPSLAASESPTISPAPTPFPSQFPTLPPTLSPTANPTSPAPTPAGTTAPPTTESPQIPPTALPTQGPSVVPTPEPTQNPSAVGRRSPAPTTVASAGPSAQQSLGPSLAPTQEPSLGPSQEPSSLPSLPPSLAPIPSDSPSSMPVSTPSSAPAATIPPASPSSMPSDRVAIMLREFVIAYDVNGLDTEPTQQQYDDLLSETILYYDDILLLEFSNGTFAYQEVQMTITRAEFGAGIPTSQFNLYVEYSATVFFGQGSVPTENALFSLLRDQQQDYVENYVRNVPPFETTSAVFIQSTAELGMDSQSPSAAPAEVEVVPPSVAPSEAQEALCSLCEDGELLGSPGATFLNPVTGFTTSCTQAAQQARAGQFSADECTLVKEAGALVCGCAPSQPCSICPQNGEMTNPDNSFADPFRNAQTTCRSLEDRAQAGAFVAAQCGFLQTTISPLCGCVLPTTPPTQAPDIQSITGRVVLAMRYFTNLMPEQTVVSFEEAVTIFYSDALGPSYTNFKASLTDQALVSQTTTRRHLGMQRLLKGQRVLQNNDPQLLQVFLRTTADVSTADAERLADTFDDILALAVADDMEGLVTALKEASLYFIALESIDAFAPEDIITSPPTPSPVEVVVPEDDSTDGLSGGAIAAVVLGSSFFVLVLLGGAMFASNEKQRQRDGYDRAPSTLSAEEIGAVGNRPHLTTATPAQPSKVVTSSGPEPQPGAKQTGPGPEDDVPVPTPAAGPAPAQFDPAAAAATSSGPTRSAAAPPPQAPAGTSSRAAVDENEAQPASVAHSADGMSYAYSLDAGDVDQPSASAGPDAGPDAVSNSMEGSTQGGESSAQTSQKTSVVSRKVMAPPGKLGIVIDTTLEGPVVHKVNPTSPLEGLIFPGDIIVAIDEVDTRAMSASAITALMVKTANQQRELTILSEDVS